MTVAQLRRYIEIAVLVGTAIAKRTASPLDDKAVALLNEIATNEALLAILIKLLGGDDNPPTGRLSEEEIALYGEIQANLPLLKSLIDVAKSAVQED